MRTIFTRFTPPQNLQEGKALGATIIKMGNVTRDRLDAKLLQLMPELAQFARPAAVIDRMVYSASTTAGCLHTCIIAMLTRS